MKLYINRDGNHIELSMFQNTYDAMEVAMQNGYSHIDALDIENYREIEWDGVEFNRLLRKGSEIFRFVGWRGTYPFKSIYIQKVGDITA